MRRPFLQKAGDKSAIAFAFAAIPLIGWSVAAAATTRDLPVTTSIGACVFSETPADVDAMLRNADKLVYDAKRAGRNRVTIGTVGDGERASISAGEG